MRLTTVRIDGALRCGRIDGEELTLLPYEDVGAALGNPDWRRELPELEGPTMPLAGADLAPVIPRPEKIIGVGLNYPSHADEAQLPVPEYPPLFAKFWRSLIGPRDHINLPASSDAVDWEVELAVVIGKPTRRCSESEALGAIAGFTVINDVSMRDWQLRTSEFLQGKTFEGSAPLGPSLVTLDELSDPTSLQLTCELDGVTMQRASTSEMIVPPERLVSYISEIVTLVPGDVIATGTPGGVGGARIPPLYLEHGQTVRTALEGVGELVNVCVAEEPPPSADADPTLEAGSR